MKKISYWNFFFFVLQEYIMKKVIASFANEEYFPRMNDFCEQEKMVLVKVEPGRKIEENNVVFFITDEKERVREANLNGIPICVISEEKPGTYWFSLKPSFKITNLRVLLDVIYYGYGLGNYSSSIMHSVFTKEYIISNDYFNIDRIVYAMTAELTMFFSFADTQKIRVGISEMITNAIEHGNLGITADEKMISTENGTYYELLAQRMKDPKISKKRTFVTIDYRDERLKIVVKDQGKGFDTSKLPDPTDTERLLRLHGRGIFITKIYFSEILFNKKGNQVTLIKKLAE